jgi:hypothetical protein
MLCVWGAGATRPTRDVDLLGHARNTVEHEPRVQSEVCTDVEPDGMVYDPESVTASLCSTGGKGVQRRKVPVLRRLDFGF